MSYDLHTGVRAALMANADLAALVGGRVTQDFAPLDTVNPYIVMQKVTAVRESAHDGDASLGKYRFQLGIGSNDKDTVEAISFILEKQFNGAEYNYVDGAVTYVLTFFHEDSRGGFNSENRTYLPQVDLTVWVNN